MRKFPFVIVLVLSFLGLGQSCSSAHAILQISHPAGGEVVKVWPKSITLAFDEPVLKISGAVVDWIHVTDRRSARFDSGTVKVQGAVLSVKLKSNAILGTYFVEYRVVSDDGHPVLGHYTFIYKAKG
jgi:methionine-rich copper-binding protein CopC